MVFVLDNYDSFTYNLVQYLGETIGAEVVVRRDDIYSQMTLRRTTTSAPALTQVLDKVIGKGIVVVENEHHGHFQCSA